MNPVAEFVVTALLATLVALLVRRHEARNAARWRMVQERKATIFNTVQEGLVLQDPAGRIIDWNPATERILGLTADQLAGRSAHDEPWGAIHPDGRPLAAEDHPSVRARLTGRPVLDELIGMVHGDGTTSWVVVNAKPMTDEATGDCLGVVVSFVDITARQEAEATRRSNEATQRASLDALDQGVILTGMDGRVRMINRAGQEILQYDKEEISALVAAGQWVSYRESGEVLPHEERPVLRTMVTGDAMRDQIVCWRQRSGALRTLQVATEPVRGPDGDVEGVVTAFQDVTEARAATRALAEAEEQVRSSFEHAASAMAMIATDGRYLRVNAAMCEFLGRDREEVLRHRAVDFVHPDDVVEGIEAVRGLLAGTTDRAENELRAVRPDGSVVWGRFVTGAIPGREGAPGHLRTHAEDITAEREAQAELRRTQGLVAEATARLEWQAFHDTLTGLPNRAMLVDRLDDALRRAVRAGTETALFFVDLDRFKMINDSLGHGAGDRLLIEVAERLAATVRPDDIVARLGGDEFVVVAEDVGGVDLGMIARRINDVLAQPIELEEGSVSISASIGIAYDRDHRSTALLRDADDALYRAKARGKNRFEVFDSELRAEALRRVAREQTLRRALDEHDGIVVHYQPVIDLTSGVLLCAEALMRIRGPHDRFESNEAFIPIAEETGLIVTIGAGIIDDACRQLARWRSEHGLDAPRQVAVNVAARQLSAPGLVETIVRTLDRTGLEPSDLCIELTESTVIAAEGATSQTVERLHELGVTLAIDDFGTGYSSLSYLKRFPVDILKLDRSFVSGLGVDASDTEIVKAVISLGRSLGLTTVAEGIETPEQLRTLQALGCDSGQGYLIARPFPGDEMMGAVDLARTPRAAWS